ncbi:MAG: hypothetical protein LBI53_02125 [Candidatus Peribacteria bacterium]|nr:hypothetical protein [Candidatus Peribacteria bacterium]
MGVQFILGRWPMPTFGIMLTKYKNLHYKESDESKQRSCENLEKGYGVDKIEGVNFGDFARRLDTILQRRYDNKKVESEEEMLSPKYFEYDELKSIVKIDKSVMEKMNIHIHPALQQFLSRE